MLKITIPMAAGRLCMHFGHCEEFAFFEVNEADKTILSQENLTPPPHEPGVIPRWIAAQNAKLAIVGGMGPMARQLLAQSGVEVITGAPADTPENLVKAYLNGTLESGENVCDHGHGEPHDNCHSTR